VSVSSSETKVTTDEATGQGRPGNWRNPLQ
jgi:hypothetical protein